MLIVALTALYVGGALLGFLFKNLSQKFSKIFLAFAGGIMLYVVSDEMIPETHSDGNKRGVTYSLLIGFSFMLVLDVLLG